LLSLKELDFLLIKILSVRLIIIKSELINNTFSSLLPYKEITINYTIKITIKITIEIIIKVEIKLIIKLKDKAIKLIIKLII